MADGEPSACIPEPGISTEIDTETQKNLKTIMCPHCDTEVLAVGRGKFEGFQRKLPGMTTKAKGEFEWQECKRFLAVNDIFDFENAGFSNAVEGVKYLTCAECEIGPIGFQDPTSRVNYVALERVRQK